MNKNIRYLSVGDIKKGIVFSDPWYGDNVTCQYRKEFQANNWLLKLETSVDEDNYVFMQLSLGRKTLMAGLSTKEGEEGSHYITFPGNYNQHMTELGIDTAKIFLGQMEAFEDFREEASIRTGADGWFGNLYEFRNKGETDPAGFLLMASIDGAIVNEEELFQHIQSSFGGNEISPEKYAALTDKNSLEYKLAHTEELKIAEAASNHDPAAARDQDKSH